MKCTPSGTPNAAYVSWAFKWAPTTEGEYIYGGGSGNQNNGTSYFPMTFGFASLATEAYAQVVMPCSGTWKRLYLARSWSDGAATLTARKNGVDQALTVTAPQTYSQASYGDTTHSFTVAAGDLVSFKLVAVDGFFRWACTFVPDDVTTFPWFRNGLLDGNVTTSYFHPNGYDAQNTEANRKIVTWGGANVSALYVNLNVAPGAGKSWAFSLRNNGGDASPTLAVTVSDAATSGNASATVPIDDGDLLATKEVPTSSPTVPTYPAISYLVSLITIPTLTETMDEGILFEDSPGLIAGPLASETTDEGILFEDSFDFHPEISETMDEGILFQDAFRARLSNPMAVAVKAGTFRIGGSVYTLPGILTIPGITGQLAATVTCNTAPAGGSGLYRYDIICVGIDAVVDYVAGTAAAAPATPATPAGHLLLGWVLLYPGLTQVRQSDINKLYLAPAPVRIGATASDADLAWGEATSTITVTIYDQNGQALAGSWTIDAAIARGNGGIAPSSGSTGGAASATFTYTRGGADPGDVSPILTFTFTYGALPLTATIFIALRDASGALMIL
jgi:hypothetical protein